MVMKADFTKRLCGRQGQLMAVANMNSTWGHCEENDNDILKLTLLSVTSCCVWQPNPKFRDLNQYPCLAVHQLTGRRTVLGLEPGWVCPICAFDIPTSGWLCWLGSASHTLLRGHFSAVGWMGHASQHPAGEANLQSHGSGVPTALGRACPPGSKFQVSLLSHLPLFCWLRQTTCQARGQHTGGGDPRNGYQSNAGIDTITAIAHQAHSSVFVTPLHNFTLSKVPLTI